MRPVEQCSTLSPTCSCKSPEEADSVDKISGVTANAPGRKSNRTAILPVAERSAVCGDTVVRSGHAL